MAMQTTPLVVRPAFGTRLPLSVGQRLGVLAIGVVALAGTGLALRPASDVASAPVPLPAAEMQTVDARYLPCLAAEESTPVICQFGYGAALQAATTAPR
jgi:hypothetical protein